MLGRRADNVPCCMTDVPDGQEAAALSSAAGGSVSAPASDASPLSELLDVTLSPSLQASQQCSDLLTLLKLLDVLRR